MVADPSFKQDMFRWLESIIKCELPGMTEEIVETQGKLECPDLPPGSIDPRLAAGPILAENNEDEFAKEFTTFVSELAVACNWHKHTFTCWKHLKKGLIEGDSNCQMCIDGTTLAASNLEPETMSILLCRLHPRINNFNNVVIFLLQCNMDIKYIGSGEAAKALVYYISDYITKNTLATHVGLEALSYAIRQNETKFVGMHRTTTASERNKSLFMKTVNAMMAHQETSHQQIMSYFVGGSDVYTNHNFKLLQYCDFDRYVRKCLNERVWYPSKDNEMTENTTPAKIPSGDQMCMRSTLKQPGLEEQDNAHNFDLCGDSEENDVPTEEILFRVEQDSITSTDNVKDYCKGTTHFRLCICNSDCGCTTPTP
jgi:hypothetical protein